MRNHVKRREEVVVTVGCKWVENIWATRIKMVKRLLE